MEQLTKKKLLIISLVLLAINLILTFALFNLDPSPREHLDGTEIEAHSPELIRGLVMGQLISIPIFSFLIGLIVAIFIDRNVPYSQRIVRGFLLTLMIIYGLFVLMGISRLIDFL